MNPLHATLTFLTANQALSALSQALKQPVTQEELLSLCENGQCPLYINMESGHGVTQLTGEPGEVQEKVFNAGRQLVHSVRAVRRARPGVPVTIQIAGPVFLDDDSLDDVVRVWECSIDIEAVDLLFRSVDIAELARTIGGVAPPLSSPKPSHLLTISVLLELLMEKGRPVYTQEAIIDKIEKRYGEESDLKVRGLGSSNLKKIFADAHKAMPDAKKR